MVKRMLWSIIPFPPVRRVRAAYLAAYLGGLSACVADVSDEERDDSADGDEYPTDRRDSGARDARSDARARDAGAGEPDARTRRDAGRDASNMSPEAEPDEDSGQNMSGPDPEPGRLAGITTAHNEVRAGVDADPPLAPLTWSDEIAQVAQAYADRLAAGCSNSLVHSMGGRYGENLAMRQGGGTRITAQEAVEAWAGEIVCWSYGTISGLGVMGTERCDSSCIDEMNSNGCGHYTQLVWRRTRQVGCGVADCNQGGSTKTYWVCNYSPPGNVVGQAPY